MLVRRRVGVIRKEGVVIAHHIVGKRDHALARKADAACGYAAVFVVRQPAFVPVPVRVEDGGERPLAPPERTIQIPCEVEAGQRLEIDLPATMSVGMALQPIASVCDNDEVRALTGFLAEALIGDDERRAGDDQFGNPSDRILGNFDASQCLLRRFVYRLVR